MTAKYFLKVLLIILTFVCHSGYAHSGKARYHTIIDSDCAADDLRTICMLLGNREIEVLAITSSEGALMPTMGAQRIASLLDEFHHQGIDVGAGRAVNSATPAWRKHSEQIIWGKGHNVHTISSAVEVLQKSIESESEPVTIIALGALTNIADLLQTKPSIQKRIERIVWYNDLSNPPAGSNYVTDPISARKVMQSKIPMTVISSDHGTMTLQEALLDSIAKIKNRYAEKIVTTHTSAPLQKLVKEQHLKCWDDVVAVSLFAPQLFSVEKISPSLEAWRLRSELQPNAEQCIIDILRGKTDSESRVFFGFPTDSTLYAEDVKPIIAKAIRRHGNSEWRAAVLTNELHGHLGIYATIGVKMGIRAREYFNIGVDDIEVVSSAGSRPPISCMNDGLQVATGASIGHGLIKVPPTKHPVAEAQFSFKGKSICLQLKPEYIEQIDNDVKQAIALHGNLTEAYWQAIRQLAIGYWLNLDRNEIFTLHEL